MSANKLSQRNSYKQKDAELTADRQLRQTTFLGWRDDRNPADIILEQWAQRGVRPFSHLHAEKPGISQDIGAVRLFDIASRAN